MHDKVCPNCGHCPTCGRSNTQPYRGPWYPWTYPYTFTYPMTAGSGVNPMPNTYIGDPLGWGDRYQSGTLNSPNGMKITY